MSKHPDQKYITALLENDEVIIESIYAQFAGIVSRFVQQNSGTAAEAKDVFQESLVDLFRMAERGFVLNRPFKAYFLAMCRYKWLDRLKANARQKEKEGLAVSVANIVEAGVLNEVFVEMEQMHEKERRYQLFVEKFKALSPHCQELIGLTWLKNEQTKKYNTLKEVAVLLDRNYSYIRREKGACTKKLMTAIKQDARYTNSPTL